MAARAEKNPLDTGHYPDITTPLQVTAPGPDPRPGIFHEEGDGFAKGGPIPDPTSLLKPFNGIGARFPKGEKAMHDKSIASRGKK
jgi:hypothetical protein